MRKMWMVLVAVTALGGVAVADQEAPPKPKPAPAPVARPVFPIPADAVGSEQHTKGGGGRIKTYQIPRGRDAVVTETREALKKGKWEITKDEPSPSGNAIRLTVTKDKLVWTARFTGDDKRAALILTLPE